MENPIKMDDLGVPPCKETPLYGFLPSTVFFLVVQMAPQKQRAPKTLQKTLRSWPAWHHFPQEDFVHFRLKTWRELSRCYVSLALWGLEERKCWKTWGELLRLNFLTWTWGVPIGSMGPGICTYIWHKFMVNVGKCTSPMDPMGLRISDWWFCGERDLRDLRFLSCFKRNRNNHQTNYL